jgi:hypothetical protein
MTSSKATLEIVSLSEVTGQGGFNVEVRLTNVSAGSLSLDPTAFAVRDPNGVDTKGDQYTASYVANPCDAGKAVSNGGSATCKVHFDVPHDYIGKAFVYSESGVTLVVPYDVDLDPPVPPPPPGTCSVVDDGCASAYPDGAEKVAQLIVKYCGCPGDVCASACAGSAGCDDPTLAEADCCACVAEHSADSCVYEAVLGSECNADEACSAFVQCENGG